MKSLSKHSEGNNLLILWFLSPDQFMQ